MTHLETYAAWQHLRDSFVSAIRERFTFIAPSAPHYAAQLLFASGRFDEGIGLVRYFLGAGGGRESITSSPINVLDVGAGNGGAAFAFANVKLTRVFTLDIVPNPNLLALRPLLPVPIRPVVGDGATLPFKSELFDVVLLLDTLEHVFKPQHVAAEILRILKPGGACMITTPARLRHVFGRDPHYGVPGLVILPNACQRFVVNTVLRRRIQNSVGETAPAYDVTHLYWRAAEVIRLFRTPGDAVRAEVLFNRVYNPPGRLGWLRHPTRAVEQLRYAVRDFFFDRIVIRKLAGAVPSNSTQQPTRPAAGPATI